jgi:hypothetical protein
VSNPAGFAAVIADSIGGSRRRFLDLGNRETREFLGRLLDLWDREQARIACGYTPVRDDIPSPALDLLTAAERTRFSEETDRWVESQKSTPPKNP